MVSVTASRQPFAYALWPAAICGIVGLALFQFFGNATRGYINTASLFYWWGSQWFNPQSETQHGLLIVPLAIGLFVKNIREGKFENRNSKSEMAGRDPTKSVEDSSSRISEFGFHPSNFPALIAILSGLFLHFLGFTTQQTRLSVVAFLLFTWGVIRLAGGKTWGDAAKFPLAFLVFAIPFNALDSIGFWLRLWVIKASAGFAHAAGIGVLQSGTQLVAPDGTYQYDVAAACSGVRSLMALLALAMLAGYLNFRTWPRRVALFLLCLPLIYLGNIARISSIIFVANWRGQAWGERAHDVMGWGVFVIVFGGLMLAGKLMQAWWPEKISPVTEPVATPATAASSRPRPSIIAGIVTVAAAGLMLLLVFGPKSGSGHAGVKLAADGKNPVELPVFLHTEWIGRRAEISAVEREILPPDTGFARKDYVSVADARKHVFMSVVLSGIDRTSIHRPELCLIGQGWTIVDAGKQQFAAPAGKFSATLLRVRREVMTPKGVVAVPQLVAYWFIGADQVVASHWRRLAIDAWNRVLHARADRWAYVLVQTDATDGEPAALARMQAVLDETLPILINRDDPKLAKSEP